VASDPYSSPLAFFTNKLKRLRENADMTLAEVAERTHFATSTVGAYETGARIASAKFAAAADKLFESGDTLTELQKLMENVSLLPWFRDRVNVERNATEIREYESYQIPGLLQTEEYARANVSSVRPMLAEDAVERAVALRMTRQQILELDEEMPVDQPQAPRYWAVFDESALLRVVGNSEIMQQQREYLITMAHRPNVTIQVIRNEVGATCAFGRAFSLLISKNNIAMAYLEDIGTAHYLRDRDEVSKYTLIFDHLRSFALNDLQSIKLIKGMNS
jgi:transcriptional regulator with XRE-family HTH domain